MTSGSAVFLQAGIEVGPVVTVRLVLGPDVRAEGLDERSDGLDEGAEGLDDMTEGLDVSTEGS